MWGGVYIHALLPQTHSIEYNVSYVYHAMYAYFDRDNVGLPGFAQYFKNESDEERGHAEMLMKYQVCHIRGVWCATSGIVLVHERLGFVRTHTHACTHPCTHPCTPTHTSQNVRGGKVKLFPLLTPELEFDHEAKGDALYAMELALSLEKVLVE